MSIDHHVQHARKGALEAIPDAFYADPSSELAQRLQRVDAALDAMLQHDHRAASYWVDRILAGWPSHRRDAVDVLETVAAVLCGHRGGLLQCCLLYTSPSPRDRTRSRMPSSA